METGTNTFTFVTLALMLVLRTTSGDDVGTVMSGPLFEQFLKHRNDAGCEAKGFYTYNAFITAAKSYGAFATTGDVATRKRELAAFFGQTSHETTGGWPSAPDGQFAWGYCKVREGNQSDQHCTSPSVPCPPGKFYYGRGPIQLTSNANYQQAGKAIMVDLINDPDLITKDAVIAFKTALWFWMTPQDDKPSCHDVITNRWAPNAADKSAGRAPGFGVITNIINGGIECGNGPNTESNDRIGYYKRYCDILGLNYGTNLDCATQKHFG